MAAPRREMHSLMEDTSTRPAGTDRDILVIGRETLQVDES